MSDVLKIIPTFSLPLDDGYCPAPMLEFKDDDFTGSACSAYYRAWLRNIKHANLPRLSCAPCEATANFNDQ